MDVRLRPEEAVALSDIAQTINAHLDLDAVLESVMAVARDVMEAEAASLFTLDEDTEELLFHVAHGEKAEHVKPIRLPAGQGIAGHVVRTGEPSVVNDVGSDQRWTSVVDDASGFCTRSILCVPLRTKQRTWGAIQILNKIDGDFTPNDAVLCQAVAGQAAVAIENARLHEQMMQSERMAAIGQTVTGMAHCVKNILNGIRGGSFMVDRGLAGEDTEKIGKGWEIVKKNSAFMEELVLDMLTYSKEREPEYVTVDGNRLIQDVCGMMHSKAEKDGVVLLAHPCDALGEVVIDEKGIRRSLLNLVSNAVDACSDREKRCVDVSTSLDEGGMFSIRVADTGCGIEPDTLPKLFRVFFSTKGSKGTGFGLAVSKKIVAEHGGRLEVESTLGAGSAFIVTLPLHPRSA